MPVGVEIEYLASLCDRPHDHAGQAVAVEGVQLVLELGHHAEVAAAAAQGPEEVFLIVGTGSAHFTIGRDDLGGAQIVDRQAMFAVQASEAAPERVPANPRVRDDARCCDETGLERCRIQRIEQRTATRVRTPGGRVDAYAIHRRQVDHQPVVTGGLARPAVAAAPNGDEQVALTREVDGVRRVGRRLAAGDQRGALVVHAVPQCSQAVVLRVTGEHHLALKRLAEFADGGFLELEFVAVQRDGADARIGGPGGRRGR